MEGVLKFWLRRLTFSTAQFRAILLMPSVEEFSARETLLTQPFRATLLTVAQVEELRAVEASSTQRLRVTLLLYSVEGFRAALTKIFL